MKPAAVDRLLLLAVYARLRLRLFLVEILQLPQRFVLVFFFVFGLILSSSDQSALRRSLAQLLTMTSFTGADLLLLACFMLYSWIVAAIVRWSARGGRVHYLAASLPLPFVWERLIRGMALALVNSILIILGAMGFLHLLQVKGSWPHALLLGAAYYLGISGSQLSLLEQHWFFFLAWNVLILCLVLSKGTALVWPVVLLIGIFAWWSLGRPEQRIQDHPELPLGTWGAEGRSAITGFFPAELLLPISYNVTKPALLIYTLLGSALLQLLLGMIVKQDIPVSQKVHVYTVITGILSILLSSFFRNFQQQRRERPHWLQSLPRTEAWWLRQDTRFVSLLYLLLTVPTSLVLVLLQLLPAPLPFLVLPAHALGFLVLRVMQRSRHMETSYYFILGFSVWFVTLGYLCDHALQEMFPEPSPRLHQGSD